MIDIELVDKSNYKILGLLVRYNRNNQGLSLRDLGQLANISHTLISNFERGLVIPNKLTINDIFNTLKIDFFDANDVKDEFDSLYYKIFKHILFYEYDQVKTLIKQLESKKHIYENSILIVKYTLIRLLYYIMTDRYLEDKDKILKQNEKIIEYFSETQKKLFYFILGIDKINEESYKEARMLFVKALSLGNTKIDVLIKEHYVITLSKAYKWVDARLVADECILEYEKQTNYIRAMRLRTRVAYDQIKIFHYDDAKDIYQYVKDFSKRYKVQALENRCNTNLAYIAALEGDFELSEYYINEVKPEYTLLYYSIKFQILDRKNNKKELQDYYNEVVSKLTSKKNNDFLAYFRVKNMESDDELYDKNEYEKTLNYLLKSALKRDDAEVIEYSSKTLLKYYKEERKYKSAMEVSEVYLHYLKYGVK